MQPHSQTFFPLGYPVTISSHCQAVLDAAGEEWHCWEQAFEGPAVTLSVEVTGSGETVRVPAKFLGSPGGFTFSAGEAGEAKGDFVDHTVTLRLHQGTVNDRAYLRYYFLEAAAYQMITALHCTPLHAACVSLPGSGSSGGVVLCGDSGAGKSSLAYACARRGWLYTSDDASYLVRGDVGGARVAGRARIVGNAHRLRLRPQAAALFEELASRQTTLRGNGDRRFEIWTRELPMRTRTLARVDRVLFLLRDDRSPPRFINWPRADAEAWFDRVFYDWAPPIAAKQRQALSLLLDHARLECFHYSRLEEAVAALEA